MLPTRALSRPARWASPAQALAPAPSPDRVAEARVERPVVELQRVDVTDSELDVLDAVRGRVGARVDEIVLGVEADDASNGRCETQRDRSPAAPGIEHTRAGRQMR